MSCQLELSASTSLLLWGDVSVMQELPRWKQLLQLWQALQEGLGLAFDFYFV